MWRFTCMGVAAVMVAACGSTGSGPYSARMGPAGGVVTGANGLRLDVPPGALTAYTQVTVTEVAPPSGSSRRVVIEPQGLALKVPARVTMRDDGSPGSWKIVATNGQQQWTLDRCCEAANWHSGDLNGFATVDLQKGKTCDPACSTGQVCVDGVCTTPNAFCAQCGLACGSSGCDGWMCGCNGGMCGCNGPNCGCQNGMCCNGSTCCPGGQCCPGPNCCVGGMCCQGGMCGM